MGSRKSALVSLDRLGYLEKLEEVLKDAGFPSVAPASVRETLEKKQKYTDFLSKELKRMIDLLNDAKAKAEALESQRLALKEQILHQQAEIADHANLVSQLSVLVANLQIRIAQLLKRDKALVAIANALMESLVNPESPAKTNLVTILSSLASIDAMVGKVTPECILDMDTMPLPIGRVKTDIISDNLSKSGRATMVGHPPIARPSPSPGIKH